MRTILFDTNIIIERENPKSPNESVARLFHYIDKEKSEKYIHPSCYDEISKYHDSKQVQIIKAKLKAYNLINDYSDHDKKFDDILKDLTNSKNDLIDNELLYQIYNNVIDVLITEDKKMLQKANILLIRSKVFTIDEYILFYMETNPELVKYKVLSVEEVFIRDVNLSDSFFDFFRQNYNDFNTWFKRKAIQNEKAYIVKDDKDIEGFLYIKTEDDKEIYSSFDKQFSPKKRLKIGTFKVISGGYRLGERFIKIIIDNAILRKVKEIYVTIFDEIESVKPLVALLESWGFVKYCKDIITGETVMVKNLEYYDKSESPKHNFPLINDNVKKYFLPIEQEYHTDLFPDSVIYREVVKDKKRPYQYALQKTYISFAFSTRGAKAGDLILIYRKGTQGNAGFTGVISTLCIIEKIIRVSSKEQLLNECENRSVFSKDQLESFHQNKSSIIVIKLLLHTTFSKKVILKELWDAGIIDRFNGPRPFDIIEDIKFKQLMILGRNL